jgi:dTMP kinase
VTGLFITLEGMDGCGKTTQIPLLAERLRNAGREVVIAIEPGGTAIGRQIRSILLDPDNPNMAPAAEMLLYFASRAQNVDEVILPVLNRGAVVLSDRFTDSTLVYQGAGRGLGADTVKTLHRIACRDLEPKLTLLLDVDLETSLSRAREHKAADRMEQQRAEFYQRVRDAYLALAAAEPERVKIIDGRDSIDVVSERIWEAVRTFV